MRPPPSDETAASILHELDLGSHLLFLMSDGSIGLLTHDEYTPFLAKNGMHLDSDETYRLFISLHEQLTHTPDVSRSKDEKGRSTHG